MRARSAGRSWRSPSLLARATCACGDWRARVDPARAAAEPEQVAPRGRAAHRLRGQGARGPAHAARQLPDHRLRGRHQPHAPRRVGLRPAHGPGARLGAGRRPGGPAQDEVPPLRPLRELVVRGRLPFAPGHPDPRGEPPPRPGQRRRGAGDEAGQRGRPGDAAGKARRRGDPGPGRREQVPRRAPASPGATSARGPASSSGSRRSRWSRR